MSEGVAEKGADASAASNATGVGQGIVPHKDPSARKDADAGASADSKVDKGTDSDTVQSASAGTEKAATADTGQGTASSTKRGGLLGFHW